MKNLVFAVLFGSFIALVGCNNSNKKATEEGHDAHQHEAVASDSASVATSYICPMKCEGSASDKPGKCPVCKMDLVAVEDEASQQ